MKILVTGRQGQLARSLAERLGAAHQLMFAGRPELDLLDPSSVEQVVAKARPDVVINAAAYTAVDLAEDEPERAWAVNAAGAGHVAGAARRVGARVVQLSTDYVYDGMSDRPYREEDATGPLGAYGVSKLAGETFVLESGADSAIVRTSWLFGPFGNNFAKTMLRIAGDRDQIDVVDDQIGSPTSTLDLADGLGALLSRWPTTAGDDRVYHFAGSGETSWAGFARRIFSASGSLGGPAAVVNGIPSASWPTKARRPANSRLNCAKFEQLFDHRAPEWEESTTKIVARLIGANAA